MVLIPRRTTLIAVATCAAGCVLAPRPATGQVPPAPAAAAPAAPAPTRAPRAASAWAPRAVTASSVSAAIEAATEARIESTVEAAAAVQATTSWTADARIEAVSNAITGLQQRQRRAAWIGIGLSCTNCTFHTEGKSLSRWVFNQPPVLYSVDGGSPADRAGLRTGDTLVSINGQALTSAPGGRAFANLVPGVAVRLGYRRGGRERTASVRPEEPPAQRDLADADAAASASTDLARALTGSSRRDMDRAQRELERAQVELGRNRGKVLSDSALRRFREYLEQAQRALDVTPSPYLAVPAPRAFVAPTAPRAIPAPYATPAPRAAPMPGDASPLRYSGRLGSAIIEARRPGGVEVVETGDSEVALTGGDLSVRIALEPGSPWRVRPAALSAGWGTARTSGGDVSQGIQGYLVNPRLGDALGAPSGVLVLDVARGSHADSLGILPGDVLVSLNDRPVVSITPDGPFAGRMLRSISPRPGAATAVVVRAHVRRTLQWPGTRGPRSPAPAPSRRR